MNGIWAIVLAAGESRRMGSPKMLLPYNDATVIEQVINNLLDADIDRVVVVLGANREEIMQVTRSYDVFHCYNEDYKDGMLSSVKCGVLFPAPGLHRCAHYARRPAYDRTRRNKPCNPHLPGE